MAECINGRGENHMVTHGPECFYCGQIPTNPFEPLRAALVAIQELHPRVDVEEWFHTMDGSDSRVIYVCGTCEEPEGNGYQEYPCATRRLADDALGGDQDG